MLNGLRSRAAWLITTITLGLAWLLVQTPALAGFLHLAPLHFDDWLLAIAGAMITVALTLLSRAR